MLQMWLSVRVAGFEMQSDQNDCCILNEKVSGRVGGKLSSCQGIETAGLSL